jgi:hypothetical protein
MLIKSEFKVDLFQLKHAREPEVLLQSIKDTNAAALGRKLIEMFPYEKTSAYEGPLPEMSLNRDHEFTDTWGVELVVVKADLVRDLIKQVELLKQILS